MGTLRGLGSGIVGRNILRHIVRLAPQHQFTSWIPDATEWRALRELSGCTVHLVRPGVPAKFWSENWSIRAELHRGRYDALFSLGDTSLPFCPVPHLLMVHQSFLAYPSREWGFEVPRSFRLRLTLMEKYFRAGLSGVTCLTVQTESMKNRLCRRWDIGPERVRVVPSSGNVETSAPNGIRRTAPRYICYVASSAPNKNFGIFARMMAQLVRRWPDLTCRLSVESREVPELVSEARSLGVIEHFEFLGRVDDVRGLLAGASVLVMPSKLESFGLPYYEAMATGCPVVAADLDFAREA